MFGLVKKVKNQIRKAEAAAALENLLKIQAGLGNINGDPHLIANNMISETWERLKKHENWQNANPPHKVAIVAIALAERVENVEYGEDSFFAYGLSLGTVLLTVQRNYDSLGFIAFDKILLNEASKIQQKACDELQDLPITKEMDALLKTPRN